MALTSVSTEEDVEKGGGPETRKDAESSADVDMRRAKDLVDLHYGLKMKHVEGDDMGLEQARKNVQEIFRKLKVQERGA